MNLKGQSKAGFLKTVLLRPLAVPGLAEVLSTLTDTRATIFMCHRFSVPELGICGHDPVELARTLALLRKRRYRVVSLDELFRHLQDGEPLQRVVAFTIDDGYFDHAQVAAPIFSKYDCPVTTFVATGFLDGLVWFWWDKLTYIFERTSRTELTARLSGREICYTLDSPRSRLAAWDDLNLRCQDAPETDRLSCVLDLSHEAEVHLSSTPPPQFAPLSWDEARKLEKQGMSFGPHTVTHPVLSTTSDDQAAFEITESWKRLSDEVAHPVPVFCYPNGRDKDFGDREISIVRQLGLAGGVAGQPGELRPAQLRDSSPLRYRVPRFPYQDSVPHVLQCVSGLELVKSRIRAITA